MVEDLHFSATVFGFGAGIFFCRTSLFEVPSNLLLEKFGARRWIARIMITWGVLAGAMALVTGPRRSIWCDFCWGRRSRILPGVILYLTYWFPSEYRARIVGLFMVAIPVSSFLGSPMSAALLGTDGWLGLRGWQVDVLLEAAPAVLLGLACLGRAQRPPADARWLDADERRWLLAKLPDASRATAPGGTVDPPAGARKQARAGAERCPGGKHCGEQRSSAVAASDHQSYGLTNIADRVAQRHSVRARVRDHDLVGQADRTERASGSGMRRSPLMLTAVSLASALLFTSLSPSSSSCAFAVNRHLRAKGRCGGVDGVAVGSNRGRRPGADQCDQQSRRLRPRPT